MKKAIFSPKKKSVLKIWSHPYIIAPATLQAENLTMIEETLGIEHYKNILFPEMSEYSVPFWIT